MPNGRCRIHGGASTGYTPFTGRYSIKRESLAGDYQRFLADPNPANMLHELAVARGLFQEFIARYPDGVPLDLRAIKGAAGLLHDIGVWVERINRVENDTALTAAEVDVLRALMASIIIEFVPEDRRQDAIDRLRQALTPGPAHRPDSGTSTATVEATAEIIR